MGLDDPKLEGRLLAIEHMIAMIYNMMLFNGRLTEQQINAIEAQLLAGTDQQTSEIHDLGLSSDKLDELISSLQNSLMTIQSRARSLREQVARKP